MITHLAIKIDNHLQINYPEYSRIIIDGGAKTDEEARTKLLHQNKDGYKGCIIAKICDNKIDSEKIILSNYTI